MADFPAMPLWTDAYLADTRHLSTAEHGAYLLLLMEAWRRPRCCLPDDDAVLARLAGATTEEWTALKPVVMGFWTLDERAREWSQKRQKKVRRFVDRSRAQKRDAAASRWERDRNKDAAASPPHMQSKSKSKSIDSPPAESLRGEGGSGGELAPSSPTPTPAGKPRARRHATKASRLPSDWPMTPERMAEAGAAGLTPEQAQDQLARFTDYWRAAPGSKGTKLDWPATWRNWCRKAADDLAKRPNGKARDGPKPFGGWVDASRDWLEKARKLDAEDAQQSQEFEGTHPRLPRPH